MEEIAVLDGVEAALGEILREVLVAVAENVIRLGTHRQFLPEGMPYSAVKLIVTALTIVLIGDVPGRGYDGRIRLLHRIPVPRGTVGGYSENHRHAPPDREGDGHAADIVDVAGRCKIPLAVDDVRIQQRKVQHEGERVSCRYRRGIEGILIADVPGGDAHAAHAPVVGRSLLREISYSEDGVRGVGQILAGLGRSVQPGQKSRQDNCTIEYSSQHNRL